MQGKHFAYNVEFNASRELWWNEQNVQQIRRWIWMKWLASNTEHNFWIALKLESDDRLKLNSTID